jgi:hypothetical protein
MKLIRPLTVDTSTLVSSNVTESEAAWAVGTNYASGATVYKAISGIHQKFTSLVNSNLGNDPETDDGTHWQADGPTNRWRMFDDGVQSQTTNADSIDVAMDLAGRLDSVCLFNISATSARITLTDPTDGLVYDETFNLVSNSGITDWYAYFFEPIVRVTDLVTTNLPPYAAAELEIVLSEVGETVKCGELVAGLSKDIGVTSLGAQLGITDYSVKQADDFGNFTVVERAFSKNAEFDVLVENGKVDYLQSLLASYRATPIVYIGEDAYTSTAVFGYYKSFTTQISYPDYAICSLQVEGLT